MIAKSVIIAATFVLHLKNILIIIIKPEKIKSILNIYKLDKTCFHCKILINVMKARNEFKAFPI